MAAAQKFFNKLTNDVLQATEQVAQRFDEGVSVLMKGELPKKDTEDHVISDEAAADGEEFGDDDDEELLLADEDMLLHSPLQGIADSVLDDILAGQAVGPQTPLEHFHAFRSAIRWTEPFLLSILAFQIVAFATCIWVSRPNRGLVPRLIVMIVILVLVRSAEYLNTFGAQHWESFSTQNYFDRNGIFMGILICGPLLLDCFIMLVCYLREASQLLVQVKKAEMKKKKKKKKEGGTTGNSKKKAANKQD